MAGENTVTVKNFGKIKGSIMKSINGSEFLAFRGVPYAEPPVGELRFKPPVPKSPWLKCNHTFDATEEGPDCIQFDMLKQSFIGKEDCLALNVYTRNVEAKQPVLVFIHGGGYTGGSGSSIVHGPRRVLDHKVVLVTINYRVHLLGFLSTSDEACPGNLGLLDQVEALKWVQQHISAFGGDPNRVTLAGESAGSSSVIYHMLSPLSKGLFHGAIAMSGSPLCPFAFTSTPEINLEKLTHDFNIPKLKSFELIEVLKSIPAEEITRVLPEYIKETLMPFTPTVDGHFITDSPTNLIKSGKIANKVPLMIGITENEGIMFYAFTGCTQFTELSDTALKKISAVTLNISPDHPAIDKVAKAVKEHYFAGIDTSDGKAVRDKFIEILSDGFIAAAHFETILSFIKAGVNQYVYSYDYRKFSLAKIFGLDDVIGATHGEDLFFLFDNQLPLVKKQNIEYPEGNKFLQMWINFVMRSNPNVEGSEEPVWKPADDKSIPVYHLSEKNSIDVYNPDKDSMRSFWMQKVTAILKSANEAKE